MNNLPHSKDPSNRLSLPLAGLPTFMKSPVWTDLDTLVADIGFLGVPYDLGTTIRSGTRLGPRGIREASMGFGDVFVTDQGVYDPVKDKVYLQGDWKVCDCGDVDIHHVSYEKSFENIEYTVRTMTQKGVVPFVIGGDHSITIPVAKALDRYQHICAIQFDAHLDWSNVGGYRYGQGSPMRRISEMAHFSKMMQIGLRGMGSSGKSDFDDARSYGSVLVSARQVRQNLQQVIDQIPDAPYYFITCDIDGLDPSLAPGTGSPQPGGLWYEEVSEILEAIAQKGKIIALDLVEVCPPFDPTGVTALYAAQIMFDGVCFVIDQNQSINR
jgi:agmatinase